MKIKFLTNIVTASLGLAATQAFAQIPNTVANNDTIVTNLSRGPISISSVLSNDTDVENDPLKILNVGAPQFGKTELKPGNVIVYTPNRLFAGTDSFTYRINDRPNGLGNSSTATVTIRNPFLLGRGIYATSLSGSGGSHDVSGYINANVSSSGDFTATFRLAGQAFRFKGKFDLSGNFAGEIARDGKPSIQLALLYATNGNTRQITGTATVGAQTIQFTAPKLNWSLKNVPLSVGRYTIALPAPNTLTATPQGTGFMTINVNRLGIVSTLGRSGDNRTFTSSTYVAPNGSTLPIYGSVFSVGSIYGDINVATRVPKAPIPTILTASGNLRWFAARNLAFDRFPSGFDLTVAATGSSYKEPTAGTTVLTVPTTTNFNSNFTAKGGNLRAEKTERSLVGKRPLAGPYRFSFDNAKRLSARVSVNSRNGLFNGSFFDTLTQQSHHITGVFIQSQNNGVGVWASRTKTGSVVLAPDTLAN